jgi:hypothetical protein
VTVAIGSRGRRRTPGEIERLPSGALRVRVYAGIDPVSKKRHDLVETVPAGPSAAREAERVRTRLLNQVDERRNPRTKATLNQLLDRWLEVVELETTTRNSMEIPARNGLNSPSRHLHAPDCHAAHRQIATIRRCPKRASPQPTTVAVPVTTSSCSTLGPDWSPFSAARAARLDVPLRGRGQIFVYRTDADTPLANSGRNSLD